MGETQELGLFYGILPLNVVPDLSGGSSNNNATPSNVRTSKKSTAKKRKTSSTASSKTDTQRRTSPRLAKKRQQQQLGSGNNLLQRMNNASTSEMERVEVDVSQLAANTAVTEVSQDADGHSDEDLLGETQEVIPSSMPPMPPLPPPHQDDNDAEDLFSANADEVSSDDEVSDAIDEEEYGATDHCFGEFAKEFDMSMSSDKYPFHQCLAHFLRTNKIMQETRVPVEWCIIIEASLRVITDSDMQTAEREKLMLENYHKVLNSISNELFYPEEMKDSFNKLKGAQLPVDGKMLICRWNNIRKVTRDAHANLPTSFASIPSGNQLYDMFDMHVCSIYAEIKVCKLSYCYIYNIVVILSTDMFLFHIITETSIQ